MVSFRLFGLVPLALLAAACGAGHSSRTAPPPSNGPVWTSPAEPSPPGSGGRWRPADERQLLDSLRAANG